MHDLFIFALAHSNSNHPVSQSLPSLIHLSRQFMHQFTIRLHRQQIIDFLAFLVQPRTLHSPSTTQSQQQSKHSTIALDADSRRRSDHFVMEPVHILRPLLQQNGFDEASHRAGESRHCLRAGSSLQQMVPLWLCKHDPTRIAEYTMGGLPLLIVPSPGSCSSLTVCKRFCVDALYRRIAVCAEHVLLAAVAEKQLFPDRLQRQRLDESGHGFLLWITDAYWKMHGVSQLFAR
mmetsp:Transcript_45680/g.73108  ORF Transcript_45680/g.73108 Transcript_45680/m.73108 type:complete len:233 (-) Transcript_45680:232-930(-)